MNVAEGSGCVHQRRRSERRGSSWVRYKRARFLFLVSMRFGGKGYASMVTPFRITGCTGTVSVDGIVVGMMSNRLFGVDTDDFQRCIEIPENGHKDKQKDHKRNHVRCLLYRSNITIRSSAIGPPWTLWTGFRDDVFLCFLHGHLLHALLSLSSLLRAPLGPFPIKEQYHKNREEPLRIDGPLPHSLFIPKRFRARLLGRLLGRLGWALSTLPWSHPRLPLRFLRLRRRHCTSLKRYPPRP